MRHCLLVLAALLAGGASAVAQTVAEPDEGLRLEATGTGTFELSWHGRPARMYVFDASEDLITWAEIPYVAAGWGAPLRFGVTSSAQRLFFRLRITDNLDSDGDGLPDWAELKFGTSPASADTDGDGIPDRWEVEHGMNPLSAADGADDYDGDGVSNLAEYLANTPMGTPSTLNDANGNAIPDCYEHAAGLALLQNSSQAGFTMTYRYDALGRLTSCPGRIYDLDAEGNLLGGTQ
ncbi:MAG TPA: hypothetical protein PK322_12875 [Opitutaceae bacterium]|nr:hypothetical protein [Opitutaceae bacterium]